MGLVGSEEEDMTEIVGAGWWQKDTDKDRERQRARESQRHRDSM